MRRLNYGRLQYSRTAESFDVIPDGTICTLQMIVHPGNAGPDGWLTAAHMAKGDSLNLDCEFVVVDCEHVKRKLWTKFTVSGDNHAVSTEISRRHCGRYWRRSRYSSGQ